MLVLPFEFRMPRLILSGPGCLEKLETEISRLGLRKPLIITSGEMERTIYLASLVEMLERTIGETSKYTAPSEESDHLMAREGANQFLKDRCDCIFVMGSGSTIDTAKAIGILTTNGGYLKDFQGEGKVLHPLPPLVAIPSTGGSGSEVSKCAMVTDPEEKARIAISSPLLIPEIAVSDPLLTLSLSPPDTAAMGLDAFCHAVESLTSRKEQPFTNTLALSAIKLISDNIRKAWCDGEDIKARSGIMLAGILGGVCTTNSSLSLIHAMSNPLSVIFKIPHGLTNASLLPGWADFTHLACPEKFKLIAETMGYKVQEMNELDGARKGLEAIKYLCEDLEVPSLEQMGIDIDDFERFLEKMTDDTLKSETAQNNPRAVNRKQILELYKKAYL